MFITEEESNNILNNPRNLANRWKNGREIRKGDIYAKSGISEIHNEIGPQEGAPAFDEQGIYKEGIQFREIKRPGNNRPWLSQSERTRIKTDATTASIDKHETRTEIAQKFGVRVSTISDIANGVRRVEDSPRSAEQEKVDLALDAVREKAIDKLMAGLGHITDEKVQAHNAKDISVICANMARVVQQTIPQEKTAQQINLVVYTPELRAEKNFDVVEI